MQQFGQISLGINQSNTDVLPYREYPADMAFAIIDRLAKDMVRGGVLIQSSNKDLRDALYTRIKQLGFEEKCYKYILNYFYGSCAIMAFITGEGTQYTKGDYLSKVNVVSFLPNVNSSFQVQVEPASIWSLAHGEPWIIMGSERLRNNEVCEIIVEWKNSLYQMLKPHSDAIHEMTRGIYTAAHRLGMLIGNKKTSDDPQEQERLLGDADRLKNASHDNLVIVDIDEKITNMAMNLSGIREAAEKTYYDMSILAGMPQNVLLGKGQGVGASAVEDFRVYSNRIKYEQDLRLRPVYRKLFNILMNESQGVMMDFDPEEIEFDFAPLQAETESEKADSLKKNLENILTLQTLGIDLAAASAIDDQVSDLMRQYSKDHINTKNKKIEGDEDAQDNAGAGE